MHNTKLQLKKLEKLEKSRKSLVLTFDAILAALAMILLVAVVVFNISPEREHKFGNFDIAEIGKDSLAVLEKDSTLKDSVKSASSTEISEYLESFPARICANITIYTPNSNTVISAQKSSCTVSATEIISAKRAFLDGDISYYADMKLWYK